MAKQYLTSITTAVAVISGYLGFFATGVLDPLNDIIVWEYTLPQIIFLGLFIALPAVVVAEIIGGSLKAEDALETLEGSIQDAVGVSQKEVERFVGDVGSSLKKSIGINAVETRNASKGITVNPFPAPEELWASLQANFQPLLSRVKVFQASAAETSIDEEEVLEVIAGTAASTTSLEKASDAAARRKKMILIVGIIVIVVSVVLWLVSTYVLPQGGA